MDDAARVAGGGAPNRIYSAKELVRRAAEPGPYHNFPESFNARIFSGNRQVISENYVLYSRRGTINGVNGTFEFGVRPSASGVRDRATMNARRSEVLMALQQALLGEVSPRIRAVSVAWGDRSIQFVVYTDGAVTEEDRESMSCSETELMALFPSTHSVTHEVVRLDEPPPIPKDEVWVYRRREG